MGAGAASCSRRATPIGSSCNSGTSAYRLAWCVATVSISASSLWARWRSKGEIKTEKLRRHKATLVEEPMFPRYLFIRLDTSGSGPSWSPIRSTLGVSQLVRFGGQPAVVDAKLIELLRTREQVGQPERLFKAGEKVVLADGPFAGIEAIFKTADAESRSMILLEMLSKPVAMRIETASLRKTG